MWKIGTRRSRLAIKQAEEFIKYFPDERFEIICFDTSGDIDKNTPISDIEGSDFFTDTIDKALLDGKIDMAVHSAKDLPEKLPEGITIAFMTKSIYPYDVLVGKGERVGVSSQRRKEQLKKYKPYLQILDIRGNIDERLEKLDRGEYDAIVVAGAGLIRLGLENRITKALPFTAHPLQGRLAVLCKEDNEGIIRLCGKRMSQSNS